jgi:lipid A 3-O-deacylase
VAVSNKKVSVRRLFRTGHCSARKFAAIFCVTTATLAQAQGAFTPDSVFVQGGTTAQTRTATVGATWDWGADWKLGNGRLTGYTETSAAYWSFLDHDPSRGRDQLGQFALVPVLRWRPAAGASPWFVEAGIGLTVTTSVYKTRTKEFSTAFNFGDHLGVGRNFGEGRRHELAVRVEHFSNASIKEPNPGETFVQLRYAYRFR